MIDRRTFIAPSGQKLEYRDLQLLVDLERNGSIAWSDRETTFNSGFKSHAYFRGRNDLSSNLPLLMRVAERALEYIAYLPSGGKAKCLIGIPTAGTQYAQAIATMALLKTMQSFEPDTCDPEICFATMRSQLKSHGKDQLWVGPPEPERYMYITVENVMSTAASMLEAFARLEQDGYQPKRMDHVVLADWGLGGAQALYAAGYHKIHPLYEMADVIAAYVHLGIWPRERYDEMAQRIDAWNKAKAPAAA